MRHSRRAPLGRSGPAGSACPGDVRSAGSGRSYHRNCPRSGRRFGPTRALVASIARESRWIRADPSTRTRPARARTRTHRAASRPGEDGPDPVVADDFGTDRLRPSSFSSTARASTTMSRSSATGSESPAPTAVGPGPLFPDHHPSSSASSTSPATSCSGLCRPIRSGRAWAAICETERCLRHPSSSTTRWPTDGSSARPPSTTTTARGTSASRSRPAAIRKAPGRSTTSSSTRSPRRRDSGSGPRPIT